MKKFIVALSILLLVTGCGKTAAEKLEAKYGKDNTKLQTNLEKLDVSKVDNYFTGLFKLDNNGLETNLGLTLSDVENYIVAVPYVEDAKMYIIVKPASGKDARVKSQIKTYLSTLENKLRQQVEMATDETVKATYTAKADLVKNRLEKTLNGYLIYIVSTDNNAVYNVIEDALK